MAAGGTSSAASSSDETRLKVAVMRIGVKWNVRVSELHGVAERLEASGFTTAASLRGLTDEIAEELEVPATLAAGLRAESAMPPSWMKFGRVPPPRPSPALELDEDVGPNLCQEGQRGFASYETTVEGRSWVPAHGGFPTQLRSYSPGGPKKWRIAGHVRTGSGRVNGAGVGGGSVKPRTRRSSSYTGSSAVVVTAGDKTSAGPNVGPTSVANKRRPPSRHMSPSRGPVASMAVAHSLRLCVQDQTTIELNERQAAEDEARRQDRLFDAESRVVREAANECDGQVLRRALEIKARQELSRLEGGCQDGLLSTRAPPPPAACSGGEVIERRAAEELLRLEEQLSERIRDDGAAALAAAPRCEAHLEDTMLDHYVLDHRELLARLEEVARASEEGRSSSCAWAGQVLLSQPRPFSDADSPRATLLSASDSSASFASAAPALGASCNTHGSSVVVKARLLQAAGAPAAAYLAPSSCASTSATSAQSQCADSPATSAFGAVRPALSPAAALCAPVAVPAALGRCSVSCAPGIGPTPTRLSITVLPPRPGGACR